MFSSSSKNNIYKLLLFSHLVIQPSGILSNTRTTIECTPSTNSVVQSSNPLEDTTTRNGEWMSQWFEMCVKNWYGFSNKCYVFSHLVIEPSGTLNVMRTTNPVEITQSFVQSSNPLEGTTTQNGEWIFQWFELLQFSEKFSDFYVFHLV